VSQSKFIVSKMMPGKIFGEVMENFPRCLNPFKIQANLIFDLFPGFLIQNPYRFGSWAKTEVCFLGIFHQLAKFKKCSS
jgi:hypothetical protein